MAEGDLAQIQLITEGVDRYQNSLGFVSTSGVEDWRAIVLEGFHTLIVPLYLAGISNDVFLVELLIRDIVPGTGEDVVYDLGTPPAGAFNGGPVPYQVAGKIRWYTDLKGRAHRGATFLPGLPAARVVEGSSRWNTDAVNYMAELADAMLTAYGPEGTSTFGRFVVISRQLDGEPRDPPVGIQVSDYETVLACRTMRKRARE